MKYSIIVVLCAVCLVACGSRRGKTKTRTVERKTEIPVAYGYKIVDSYPHDAGAYTQGLFRYNGEMWESTGEYGRSTLRAVALPTGKIIREKSLDESYFAEGAAFLDGRIYQLTWLEEKCFVYDAVTLELVGEFTYKGEGWGLTTDGERLYMSDGTANITVRNPATFRVERTIAVRNSGKPVQYINELEWIDGKIWANLYIADYREMTSPRVVVIDPSTGNVEGVVDFSGIYGQLTVTPDTDVMNGIAYDPDAGRIFVTGKNWDKLFEVEIFKK
jgi:glutamine cyclotransferase